MSLHTLSIKQAHEGLTQKKFSCKELTQSCLDRVNAQQESINAFITVTDEYALKQADAVDTKINQGSQLDILEGIPCGVKDNMLVQDILCTSGSKILSNYQAPYNATVIEKLKENGYVLIGKTNLDEFSMGSSTENSYFGPTKNPHDITRVPGGTSGGSAAAVADNQVIYALGSDTGGSIRQPAALCGCVGLKPTYGRISRYGLIAMTSSFDQIGPLTKNVHDAAYVLDALYGHDKRDATSVVRKEDYNFADIEPTVAGKRIGYAPSILVAGMDPEIKTAIEDSLKKLEQAGAELVEVELPHLKYSLAAYYLILFAESSSNLARFDGIRYGYRVDDDNLQDLYERTRGEGFGTEVQRRIMLGTYVLSAGYYDAFYKKAQKLRSLIMQDYANVFKQVDCLVTPTTPNPAFEIGSLTTDPLTMYLEDVYTVAINVAGVPALSMPCGMTSQTLPIGIQFIASHFNEKTLFEVAGGFEKLT